MSRHSQRNACFGRSPITADPLVAEIAGAQAIPFSVSLNVPLLPSPADDAHDSDELAVLDERLLAAASTTHAEDPERAQARVNAAALAALRTVRLPTIRALRTASLQALRAAIARTSESDEPQPWAAYHLILGVALRLRANRKRGHQRAQILIEATRAFDAAFGVYAALRTVANGDQFLPIRTVPDALLDEMSVLDKRDASHRRNGSRPFGACLSERDGTLLVARAIVGPLGTGSRLLERAVMYLRLARAGAELKSWSWISNTNNLACALTLLGNRTPAPSGSAMLREATQVLSEVLKTCDDSRWRADRASTLINLAEALLSLAERETPDMRLKKIERALAASSVALLTVAPPEWASLLQLTRVALD